MTLVNIVRNYSGSDSYMVNQCSIAVGILNKDLATFTNYDSTIDVKLADQFQSKINKAFTVVSDSVAIIPQKKATAAVLTAVDEGKNFYDDIIYFVTNKAFPGNKAIAKEFGVGKFKAASSSQVKFTLFLETLHQKAIFYKTELLAAGCSQTLIDNLGKAAQTLNAANVRQEILKRGRPVLTADRIGVLNDCFAVLSIINAAAANIYRNDAARKKQFVYSPASKSQKVTAYQAPIVTGTTETVFNLPYHEERTLTLQSSDADLEFGLSVDGKAFTGNTVKVIANTLIIKKSIDLATVGDYLLCKNDSGQNGMYDVEADR